MINKPSAAFVALGVIWGSNFIFMKWASVTITAGQITLLRVLCGFLPILYYFIVDHLGAITASSATYIPPVVALAIGWLLVDEPLDILDGAAVLLILTGVVVLRSGSRRPSPTP